ncbi:hypothetical protein VM1G_11078 [Cytospora mali]|uniref:Uncharacterized protein n=1 Tax=Cytospora mali TaxID=578113 RepID=A0A194VK74_CYTMA|nr:hypothetical protein VM1G_11078 [Valsa mali]
MKTKCSLHRLTEGIKKVIPKSHRAQGLDEQGSDQPSQTKPYTDAKNSGEAEQLNAKEKRSIVTRFFHKLGSLITDGVDKIFDLLFLAAEFLFILYFIYKEGPL